MIYEYLVVCDEPITFHDAPMYYSPYITPGHWRKVIHDSLSGQTLPRVSLLRTCRSIAHEVIPVLYGRNKFCFRSSLAYNRGHQIPQFSAWVEAIGEVNQQHLGQVIIMVHASASWARYEAAPSVSVQPLVAFSLRSPHCRIRFERRLGDFRSFQYEDHAGFGKLFNAVCRANFSQYATLQTSLQANFELASDGMTGYAFFRTTQPHVNHRYHFRLIDDKVVEIPEGEPATLLTLPPSILSKIYHLVLGPPRTIVIEGVAAPSGCDVQLQSRFSPAGPTIVAYARGEGSKPRPSKMMVCKKMYRAVMGIYVNLHKFVLSQSVGLSAYNRSMLWMLDWADCFGLRLQHINVKIIRSEPYLRTYNISEMLAMNNLNIEDVMSLYPKFAQVDVTHRLAGPISSAECTFSLFEVKADMHRILAERLCPLSYKDAIECLSWSLDGCGRPSLLGKRRSPHRISEELRSALDNIDAHPEEPRASRSAPVLLNTFHEVVPAKFVSQPASWKISKTQKQNNTSPAQFRSSSSRTIDKQGTS